jgi:stage II sporulation protein Q
MQKIHVLQMACVYLPTSLAKMAYRGDIHMNNQEKETNTKNEENVTAPRKTTHKSGVRALFAKKWTFPVLYLAAAGLIISLMYVNTHHQAEKITPPSDVSQANPQENSANGTSTETNAAPSFQWPVGPDAADASVIVGYYDENGDPKAQAAALVNYNGTFYTHNGIDIQAKGGAAFSVLASANGTVTNVEDNALNGKTVTISHPDGYVTIYASLGKVEVQKGDQVKQGQVIGESGFSRFEANAKNHLYFEVRKDGTTINPVSVLPSKTESSNSPSSTTNDQDQ